MFRCLIVLAFVGSAQSLKVSATEGTWGAPDLTAVTGALNTVLAGKHLTTEQRTLAQHVADDVKKDVAVLVAGGDKLSKEVRRATVADAMKEMGSLQAALTRPTKNATAIKDKLAAMMKELTAKKAELAKDEDQMKLLTLEKELAEKRMQLEGLEEAKRKQEAGKAGEEAAAKQREMVAKLVAMAKGMKAAKAGAKAAPQPASKLAGILSELEAHAKSLTTEMSKMDAANKKIEGEMAGMINKVMPNQGKSDAVKRGQSMLKSLKKKEQRKYEKARAVKKAELNDIEVAIASIKKGDAQALQKVLVKMQAQEQAAKAKTGTFLH